MAAPSAQDLPKTHQALVLLSTSEPLSLQTVPTPSPTPGSVVVRVLSANISSYSGDIYNGKRGYPIPTPSIVGASGIGRIVATGPDTVALSPGDLVLIDSGIYGRDDPDTKILFGIHEGFSDASRKLMAGEWRNSTYAEYAKVPLENCERLDEKRLCSSVSEGGLGYEIEELGRLHEHAIAMGGLDDVNVEVGDTVIVAPATGNFGRAAVRVAVALGAAKVIAMGRDQSKLDALAESHERISAVRITGYVAADTAALKEKLGKGKGADVYFDISPPAATSSSHFKSCITALRPHGRVSLMGGVTGDVALPLVWIMFQNITLKGTYMYTREQRKKLVKMLEGGLMVFEKGSVKKFGLHEWDAAAKAASDAAGTEASCVICP
ncbi:hypothetical protein FH972_022148 [Carpinus fangiana]|uniref:Alcohol dehydrogenase-like C-terminal domain-containing protein n=1 Tax=Carpinus fangiana TaxID=176857 RepID=A0A5N6KS12_9ROSI|nr:hypothetical protein FH972_022148 [Carpinus fangiana]